MESWGPIFRVSIDLNIKSRVDHLVNIISFKANNGTSEKGNHGDRIPSINFDGQQLEFVSSVNGNPQYVTRSDKKIELDTWYNIVVKQELRNDKVRIIWTEISIFLSLYFDTFSLIDLLQHSDRWRRSSHCSEHRPKEIWRCYSDGCRRIRVIRQCWIQTLLFLECEKALSTPRLTHYQWFGKVSQCKV